MVELLTAVAALLGSVAWPLAVVMLAVLFRKPLAALIGRTTHVKAPGVEIDLGQQIRELEAKVADKKPELAETQPKLVPQRTVPALGAGNSASASLLAQARDVADISPAAAVSLAWTELEGRLQRYLAESGGSDTPVASLPASQLLNELLQRKLIDSVNYGILSELRQIRNRAVHNLPASQALSARDAAEYVDLASGFMQAVDMGAARGVHSTA